jgi:hypothetical protein
MMGVVYGRCRRPLLIHNDQDTIVSHHVAMDTHGRIPHVHIVALPDERQRFLRKSRNRSVE